MASDDSVDPEPPPGSQGPSRTTRSKPARKETLVLGTPPSGGAASVSPGADESGAAGPASEPRPTGPQPSDKRRTTRQGTVMLDGDEGSSEPPHSNEPSPRRSSPLLPPPSSRARGRGQYNLDRAIAEAAEQQAVDLDQQLQMSRERLSQLTVSLRPSAVGRQNRTSFLELATIATDVAVVTEQRLPRRIGWQLVLSAIFGVVLVVLVLGTLFLRQYAWLTTPVIFVGVLMLVAAAAVKGLPKLARRVGDRPLPGGLHVWLGTGTLTLLAVAAFMTWGAQEATAQVVRITFPHTQVDFPEEEAPPEEPQVRADVELKKGGRALRVKPGLLYVPESFASADGAFDVILFFHGYPPLVQDSVEAAEVNALVHMTNIGLGGRPYKSALAKPDAFDKIIAGIEEKAQAKGLAGAKVRHVAVASWSAGYGALFQILKDPKRDTPIDAVLGLDGLHGSFVAGDRQVQPASVAPYVRFARQAIAGEKLFIITHSAIPTYEYPSSTESADAILEPLGLVRSPANPGAAPETVGFDTALHAFPGGNRKWLEPVTEVHAGNFHLFGYSGDEKEDHIAHLAQMATSVLPMLKKRWASQ